MLQIPFPLGASGPSLVVTAQGTHWHVEDTSTNGTFVDGVRVPKNGSLPLPLGALLRLSNVAPRDPCSVLE